MAEETPTTPTTSPPAAPNTWFDAFDAETKGHLQNKGWDKLDAAAAVAEAVKAHRAAEKRLGAPADELVRLPKDPNDAAWGEAYKRLGKPEAPEGYDLSPLSPADKPLAPELVSALQAAAHKSNMTPGQALSYTDAILKHQAEVATKASTEASFNQAAEVAKLDANWGSNKETNLFVARRAAEVLGISPEAVTALEKVAGYATTMETMRKLGVAMGESRVIQGQQPGNTSGAAMSADQATARIADLKNDSAWLKSWANGGVEQKRELEQLTGIIVRSRQPR